MENKKLVILNHSQQFEECKKKGSKLFLNKKLMLSYKKNTQKTHRFGWTVPRYTGTAVTRNKMKRYCREFFRKNNFKSNHYFDVNIVFLKSHSHEFKSMAYREFAELLQPAWQTILNKN